jgi:hypothetical protein
MTRLPAAGQPTKINEGNLTVSGYFLIVEID